MAAFFERHCVRCHDADEPEAKVAVHDLAGQPRSAAELALWKRVVGELESGHMPPDDEPQPSLAERRQWKVVFPDDLARDPVSFLESARKWAAGAD